jgi:SEC-C motif domain protein
MKKFTDTSQCPCGSGVTLGQCCGAIISGKEMAKSAEALMRSRYTAYVVGDIDHIKKTQDSKSGGDFDEGVAKEWSQKSEWKSLEVVRTEKGLESDSIGMVEFKATFLYEGKESCHHETAFFKKQDGNWVFSEGKVVQQPFRLTEPKIGRNDPCGCGSGKKYKKCCLAA